MQRILFHLTALALLAMSLYGLRFIAVNNEVVDWLPAKHPDVMEYKERVAEKGHSTRIIVVVSSPKGAPRWSDFERVNERGTLLAQLPGGPRVEFLLDKSRPQPSLAGDSIATESQFEAVLEDFSHHPLRYRPFGSRAQAGVVYSLSLEGKEKSEALEAELVDSLHALAGHPAFAGVRIHSAGTAVTAHGLNDAVFSEGLMVLGASYLVLVILLALFLRDRYQLLKGVGVLILTSLTTHGLMGLFGLPLNIMTVSVSSLVLIIGIADIVHIANHLKNEPGGALSEVFVPCLWTTLTTVMGFGSLALSNLPILVQFGIASSLGIGSALFWSFYCFSLRRKIAERRPPENSQHKFRYSHRLIKICLGAKPAAVLLLLVLLAGSVLIKKLKVDADPVSYLPEKSQASQDLKWVFENLYSPTRMEVLLKPREGNILDSANLDFAVAALERLEQSPEYADLFSPLTGYSSMEIRQMQVLNPGVFQEIAESNEISVSIGTPGPMSSRQISDWKKGLSEFEFPGLTMGFHGFISLSGMMFDHILITQIQSGAAALGLICLVLVFLLRNFRLILLGLVVNILPAVILLIYMAMRQLELDITTVCITSILMGVVVDDTIHLMWTVKRFAASPRFPEKLRECVSAITGTTIILTFGFAALSFSGVKSIHLFGALMALGVAAAWILDVAAIPFIVRKEAYDRV